MPSSTPNLSSQATVDETKQYNRVVFQQGKPVLDTDLNDLSGVLLSQTAGVIADKLGFGPPQLNYREWAIVNNSQTPSSQRNTNNFGITLGRLPTSKGVVDTAKFAADGLGSSIAFDFHLLDALNVASADDRPYANYILQGKVTSASSTTSIVDENKAFNSAHGLLARSTDLVFSPASSPVISPVNSDLGGNLSKAGVRFQEGACRIVFTSGALEGQTRELSGFTATSLSWDTPLSSAPSVGDEYVIVPANMLAAQKTEYDAFTTQAQSQPDGFNNISRVLTYIQVFEEDISSEEDSEIINGALGFETTHRSQLRWCVRTALVRFSKAGDVSGSDTLTHLRPAHIYAALQGTATATYQAALDSVGALPQSALSHYWREVTSAGSAASQYMGDSPSPFYADGITPLHMIASVEASFSRLLWPFLKVCALMSLDGMSGFNDVQVINLFHAESKSKRANKADETLSPIFYLGATTDTTQATLVHARLGVAGLFNAVSADSLATPASYLAPPRMLMNAADMSTDMAAARSFGPLASASAPYVFPSLAAHMGALDAMLIGLLGLGSIGTAGGVAIPSSADFQLADTSSSLAQSGYGAGAVRPVSPLSAPSGVPSGFLSGASSYLLREKGARDSHTVNVDDEDLGWSFYKKQGAGIAFGDDDDFTDMTARKWHEGMAQAKAFADGLNFRKLAIKTTAHKSMDLFTIADRPFRSASDEASGLLARGTLPSARSIMLPKFSESASGYGKDSYTGLGSSLDDSFIPSALPALELSPLISSYREEGHGVQTIYKMSSGDEMRELPVDYGLWNRFDVTAERESLDEGVTPLDLWHNRATAMRLRYHVGDFYPSTPDSRGVPRNLLVDSLNLFVRIEPLSLTHWMTMPKHQHTILENSLVFAEGIEALLKVSHGLGDVQKLVSTVLGVANTPLAQAGSPAVTEGLYPGEDYNSTLSIGQADVTNMPFAHEAQPFVHWYHPAMHKIKMPHPTAGGTYYTNTAGAHYTVSPYPKWGRRSTIVPALAPMMIVPHEDSHSGDVHVLAELAQGGVSAENILSTADNNSGLTFTPDSVDFGLLPYLHHGTERVPSAALSFASITTDNGVTLQNYIDQISFPMRASVGTPDVVGPVFLPASRKYVARTSGPQMGFHPVINANAPTQWDDIADTESRQPYDERLTWWAAASGSANDLPDELKHDFNTLSVPVMRAAIRTTTVAEIVRLVRTSFETALQSETLPSEYSFTMPASVVTSAGYSNQTPAVGPDVPADTLFVGDMGTAIGGSTRRTSFMSPLNIGVGSMTRFGVSANADVNVGDYATFRDSFEMAAHDLTIITSPITSVFLALQKQGLQQKLLFNCSFRVLHHRPSGRDRSSAQRLSSAPKSITEAFLVHDRSNGGIAVPLSRGTASAEGKPFIHLASMHPASAGITLTSNTSGVTQTVAKHPNYDKMKHLYPMVSDSLGAHRATESAYPSFTDTRVQTGVMGDVFDIDPYDLEAGAPMLSSSNTYDNSGIEIDLLSELNYIHAGSTGDTGLDIDDGGAFKIIDTMPTANEMTLPGDHEIVFVLYTGHYGARLHDTSSQISDAAMAAIPSVAGCHLTATLEINRPSERVSSTEADEHHYGVTVDGAPIKTYAIMSSVTFNS
jgi:hypothetical protein